MSDKYILDGHNPIPCSDLMEWGEWFNNKDKRRVALDYIRDIKVSTVFLGLDHSFGYGPPLLFETMIFGGEHDQYQERYSTWNEAEDGHKRACDLVRQS